MKKLGNYDTRCCDKHGNYTTTPGGKRGCPKCKEEDNAPETGLIDKLLKARNEIAANNRKSTADHIKLIQQRADKESGVIVWSWILICAPLWIPLIGLLGFALIIGAIMLWNV